MEVINTMKRYELKYILNKEQTAKLEESLCGHMEVDQYGLTSIASLYYDTNNYRLIRESIDKPFFKEKIRLRSYGIAKENTPVYLELKRKAYDIVYKRRIQTTEDDAFNFFNYVKDLNNADMISKEINYFRDFYKSLKPACLIIYDRKAYFEKYGDLRLTIDFNPRYRMNNLNLCSNMEGTPLFNSGEAILEIKVQDAVPSWLSTILTNLKIYKSNFSKYGEAFKKELRGGFIHV